MTDPALLVIVRLLLEALEVVFITGDDTSGQGSSVDHIG